MVTELLNSLFYVYHHALNHFKTKIFSYQYFAHYLPCVLECAAKTGSEILPEPKRRFIVQSLSCSPFHHLEMTEILLKGCKTLTHPSIHDLGNLYG